MAAPRSKQFDDVYFSAEDGFAETQHVFIQGSGLPGRWAGRDYTIFETGFGTGLNFLCAWRLWNETNRERKLEFISVEKFPLSAAEIENALEAWRNKFPEELTALIEKYPQNCSGTHRIAMGENCALVLIFDDVNAAIPKQDAKVDAWFLDGFKPKKNPEMWTDVLFENMARLSNPDASVATFTAAGNVRRGLQAAGFNMQRVKGYGTKWHMLTGVRA